MIINCKKKPVVIQAVQWNGYNTDEIIAFTKDKARFITADSGDIPVLFIKTLEGDMRAPEGSWIIRGPMGEYYPCRREVFEETYEPMEE